MRRTSSTGKLIKPQGFTYVIVLVTIVIVSIMAQVTTTFTSRIVKADKELELLFRGQAYVEAIASYYSAQPKQPIYPRYLSELESDSRFLKKRHIRRLYPEPFANNWQLLRNAEGGIIGVASSSAAPPLKVANFPKGLEFFSGSEHYHQWQFLYLPSKKSDL